MISVYDWDSSGAAWSVHVGRMACLKPMPMRLSKARIIPKCANADPVVASPKCRSGTTAWSMRTVPLGESKSVTQASLTSPLS